MNILLGLVLWSMCYIPAIIEPLRPHETIPAETVTPTVTAEPTPEVTTPVWPTDTVTPIISEWPTETPTRIPTVSPEVIPTEKPVISPEIIPSPSATAIPDKQTNPVAEEKPVKTEWAYVLTNALTRFIPAETDVEAGPSVLLQSGAEIVVDTVMLNGKPVDYTVNQGRVEIDPAQVQAGKNRVTMEVHDSYGNFMTMKPWEFYEEELFPQNNCAIIKSNDTDRKTGEEIVQGPSKKKTMLIVIGTICAVIILAVGGIALGMHVVSTRQEKAAAEEQKAAEAKEKEEQEALAAQQAEQKAKEEAEAKAAAEAVQAAQQAAIDKAQAEALEGKRENAETLKIVGHATTGNVNEYALASGVTGSGEETQPLVAGSNGHKVAIDAGHQAHGNSEKEPIGPGASESKAKVASGTHGDASGLDEYELNLQVSLQLRDELTARGYEVYMIRETHDVNISNAERAQAAADAGSEILVRVHANGSDDHSVAGALTMAPGSDNSFLSTDLIQNSQRLSQIMIDSFCAETGAKNLGVQNYNNMSGINWSTIPVTIVEMGFMTNADEDLTMASADYQKKMVQGIANGVDTYFAG
ncbi:MAG: N-acetylmuramoyl-L-alanine amidase [Lachnospiraceae bacterium]|nr:N-acetylmuramoyl-L-alanine amidase [Lachnospiraceae bacterium]